MGAQLGGIREVTDVVANAVFIDVLVNLPFAGKIFRDFECFPNRSRVVASAADVVDIRDARGLDEFLDEAGDVVEVDFVADLLALLAEGLVFAPLEVALHEAGEEAVEFSAGMVRSGQAATAQAGGVDAEVAAVFLDHHAGRHLGSSEERVLGLVDGKVLGDTVGAGRVGVVPAGFQLAEGDRVGPVAIDLVGGHVDEGRFRTSLTGRFEQVERADGIGVEVFKRDRRGAIMRWLGGGVDDGVGLYVLQQLQHALAIPDVQFVVGERGTEPVREAGLAPAGVALRAEEDRALVVIDAMDVSAERGKMDANFGIDEAGRAGDEEGGLGGQS